MARVRDALRLGRSRQELPAPVAPAPRAYHPDPDILPEPEPSEEIPYIEVGGPRDLLDASPSVAAAATTGPAPGAGIQVPAALPKPESPPALSVSLRMLTAQNEPARPPAERFDRRLVAYHEPEHALSRQYQALARDLLATLPAKQSSACLIAGATATVDVTIVVLNLAITIAKSSVAVVDADLTRGAVAEGLGMTQAPGLRDVLAGTLSLHRALRESGLENLWVLTAGTMTSAPGGVLAGEPMRAVLRHLRLRCPQVLVAAPHWDGRPDLVALGAACDAVYLVVPSNETDRSEVRRLVEVLPEQRVPLRGCILLGPASPGDQAATAIPA